MLAAPISKPELGHIRFATWNVAGGRKSYKWWEFLRDELHVDLAVLQEAVGAPEDIYRGHATRQFNKGTKGKAIYVVALNETIKIRDKSDLSGGAAVSFCVVGMATRFIGVHALRSPDTGHTSDVLAAQLCIDASAGTQSRPLAGS